MKIFVSKKTILQLISTIGRLQVFKDNSEFVRLQRFDVKYWRQYYFAQVA